MSKLLIFTKLFWPEGGGAELATYLIAENILSKHFEVTIISGTKRPHARIKHCKYVCWSLFTERYKPVEWLKLIGNARQFARLIEQADIMYIPSHTLLPLAMISKRIKPSVKVVVHLHNYQPLTYTSVLLAGRRPNMATDLMVERREHDSLLRAVFAGLGHYINLVSRLALHYADKVICVSRRQHEILIKNMPMLKGKTIMIYNPLPQLPNVEKGLDPKPIILYAGGDSYVKGFHTFLRASQKVLEQGYDVKFLLAGGFKNVNRLIIEKLNERFKGAYNLLGYLRHEKFLKLHTITHALLFPSICEEPFPYVVLEAMLMGTLPVASKVGGIPEIVKGTYAEKMLFEAGNVEEFVDRMESILAMSKEQIKDVGFSLREATLKRFNSEITKRNLVKIFS